MKIKLSKVVRSGAKGRALVPLAALAVGCGGKAATDSSVAATSEAITAATTDTAQYSFESGTQGWVTSGPPVTVALTTTRAFAGSGSLQVNFNGTGTAAAYTSPPFAPAPASVVFHVWCPSGVVSTVDPYVEQSQSGIVTDNPQPMSALAPSAWNTISVAVPANATPLFQMGVRFQSVAASGACFIDSIGGSASQASSPDAGQSQPADAGQSQPADAGQSQPADAGQSSASTDAGQAASADAGQTPAANGNCGMQLGGPPALCQTFDSPSPVTTRAGQLDGTLWGVSRAFQVNLGQGWFNNFAGTTLVGCSGTTSVLPPNDVIICNGQLREALNDNPSGVFEGGSVPALAMYPKQPFDFANRTGTVSFDVTNDSDGGHSAWPELWITDEPTPAPVLFTNSWIDTPPNALRLRFANVAAPGDAGECPNSNNLSSYRWTVDSAAIVRNYQVEDNFAITGQSNCSGAPSCVNTGMMVTPLDCVTEDRNGPNGGMNHVEVRVSANQIDVYATDAGTTAPLKHIAVITNTNMTFTRGLVWFEDMHYNADKGGTPSQREHTFAWDNLAFDGPVVARDLAYDALDEAVPGPNNTVNLGQHSGPNQTASWNVLGVAPSAAATAVKVLFNFYAGPNAPTVLNVNVNGHAHSMAWPYPDNQANMWRTLAVPIPPSDLVSGTNVVALGGDIDLVTSNVDIVLAGAGGIVPPSAQ